MCDVRCGVAVHDGSEGLVNFPTEVELMHAFLESCTAERRISRYMRQRLCKIPVTFGA